jgi:pimeloyl-ACP methyl ester carboxylesterase
MSADLSPLHYATTSDGVRIAYMSVGDGPPLVFASNIFGDATRYRSGSPHVRHVSNRLARLGWRVILYDHRGMGASDRDVEDLSLEGRVRDLAAVIDAVGLDRFALGGVDIGAATAIAYAVEHQAVVTRLLLLSPWASGALPSDTRAARRLFGTGQRRARMEAVRQHPRERGLRIQRRRLRPGGNGVLSADQRRQRACPPLMRRTRASTSATSCHA